MTLHRADLLAVIAAGFPAEHVHLGHRLVDLADRGEGTEAWFENNAPRLVRCSITGYGTSGPKAALPGYDFILQAESGLMSICGEPNGVPTK